MDSQAPHCEQLTPSGQLRHLLTLQDLDRELWRYGIPSKTRHNEVAPAQFELAVMLSELLEGMDQGGVLCPLSGRRRVEQTLRTPNGRSRDYRRQVVSEPIK